MQKINLLWRTVALLLMLVAIASWLCVLEQYYFIIQFEGYKNYFFWQLFWANERREIIDRLLTVSCEGKRALTMYLGSTLLFMYVLLQFLQNYVQWVLGDYYTQIKYIFWALATLVSGCYLLVYYSLFQWFMNNDWDGSFSVYYTATRLTIAGLCLIILLPWTMKIWQYKTNR